MEPLTLWIAGLIATNTPCFLEALRGTLLDQGKEFAVAKGKRLLDDKEQQRHLEQVLKKAVKRGLARFRKQAERDQYRDILDVLFEQGPHSDILRREVTTLFSLSDAPNVVDLNEIYNQSLRSRNLSRLLPPIEVDADQYLKSFFDALVTELYADSVFQHQISETLQARANIATINTAKDINQIRVLMANDYTEEQFKRDVEVYTTHIERVLHNLKIVGVVPKDQNRDPELNGIFVPLQVALQDYAIADDKKQDSLVDLLEKHSQLVLLGGPGSGKSTAVRHLAWSHAATNLSSFSDIDLHFLPSKPLPLRIELRLFTQIRKHQPDYDFLTYVVKVLLGGEGIRISSLMFDKLLRNKSMLVLFDGLDEVATLSERKRLVEEIEHFTQLYPNSYVLVTSRPVGYNLASCSKQLFSHAQVQDFNDEQIKQFLKNWYIHVLRLFPIPQEAQEELETLYAALRNNSRLHKLAENPLLLTVITALYRSERLPDRRVQVYDRCANLLLETWAKLKGTDIRWKEIKMEKEDQFACVAHLGYVLHKQSQESNRSTNSTRSSENTASDVSTKFMLREIEHFLKDRKLITEGVEQHAEASHFLDLMKVEAGLIVERGKGENDEELYGFVHRTFQEYFAAADIYERYQQEEDAQIISSFLEEHLHDPHWSEVISLLLNKLKPRPLTKQLQQIIEGKLVSKRSQYTNIIQQDLFFVCKCLAEEMPVEASLVELIIECLTTVVRLSSFREQRSTALHYLGRFLKTRLCAKIAQETLMDIVMRDKTLDIDTKIIAAEQLYIYSAKKSPVREQSIKYLLHLTQSLNFLVEQRISAAQILCEITSSKSREKKLAVQILLQLTQNTDQPIEQRISAARVLCEINSSKSYEKKLAIQMLVKLFESIETPREYKVKTLKIILYAENVGKVDNKFLIDLALRNSNSIDLKIKALDMIYYSIYNPSSKLRKVMGGLLLDLIQHTELSIVQQVQAAYFLEKISSANSKLWKQAKHILLSLAQTANFSIEQKIQYTTALYQTIPSFHHDEPYAERLIEFAQDQSLTTSQRLLAATAFLGMDFLDDFGYIAKSVQLVLTLLQKDDAKQFLCNFWINEEISGFVHPKPSEFADIVNLATLEQLPTSIHDEMYSVLSNMVFQFNEIPSSEVSQSII